jgi:amino acid permease
MMADTAKPAITGPEDVFHVSKEASDLPGKRASSHPEELFDATSKESAGQGDIVTAEAPAPLLTRLGLTPSSFRRREQTDEHNQLNKTLKPRHLSMIAIGGSIGAGLFVGSGSALAKGGPAALFIGFGIIGIMIFNVVYALGELAVMYVLRFQHLTIIHPQVH